MPLAYGAPLACGRDAVDAVEAGDVDLDARLGEREVIGLQTDLALGSEDRAGERLEGALEVRERDIGVDREPLDLVELGRVRRVGVRPVDAARDDDVDRRRLGLHRADLHRARVSPENRVLVDVEADRRLLAKRPLFTSSPFLRVESVPADSTPAISEGTLPTKRPGR